MTAFLASLAGADEGLPGITRAHYLAEDSLRTGEMGMEWGYRLFWLSSPDGKKFGLMVNVLDTAGKVLVPVYPPFSLLPLLVPTFLGRVTAQVSVIGSDGVIYQTVGQVGNADEQFHFAAGDWDIRNDSGAGRIAVHSSDVDLDLATEQSKPAAYYVDYEDPQPGWLNNNELGKAVYVSQTRETAQGTMRIGDKTYPVSGSSWLDRQWMTRDILGQVGQNFAWRWFSVQLGPSGSDSDLMIYQLWNPRTGQTIKTYGAQVDASGSVRALNPENITITPLARQSTDGRDYETRWKIAIPELNGLEAELRYQYDSPWTESDSAGMTMRFLEGSCDLQGTIGSADQPQALTGNAWAEQVSTDWIQLGFLHP